MITFGGLISAIIGQKVFAGQLADNVLLLSSGNAGQFSLAHHTLFYDPGVQTPGLADMMQLPLSHWVRLEQRPLSIVLHQRHAIWYRVPVKNDGSDTQTMLLRDSSPLTDTMTSYLCSYIHDSYTCKKTDKNPYSKNLQGFSLAPGESAILLVESTGFHSLFFSLSLQTPNAFTSQQYGQRIYWGLLDGILCGLVLYSLLIAIQTRKKAYFAYSVFCTCVAATFFVHQDFFYTFVGILPNAWLTNISMIMPMIDSAGLASFIGYYIYASTPPPRTLMVLKLYAFTMAITATALLLNTHTIFLVPVYGLTTVLVISYFLSLCLTEKKQPRTGLILLCLGISLPLTIFIIAILASLGFIKSIENLLLTIQSLETVSSILFASAILLSIKHLREDSEIQARIVETANITNDIHNRLLSHLNHELRTPLNGILGAAEILMHKAHLPKDRRVFSMIYHTALPLKHLIEDMVNIQSITQKNKLLQNTRFDLHNLLQECMDIFLLTAHDKKIRLYFRMENDVTSDITADANRIRQILINLIGNACKFTSDSIVGLYVSQEATKTANEHIYKFEIIDRGKGINEKDEKNLFEIFESEYSDTNPKGTGIGLSIVWELSHMMGGDCGYRRNTSGGSTFWFSIKVTTHHSVSRKIHGAFEGLNILLADEDPDLADSICGKISDATESIITVHTEQQISSTISGGKRMDIALIHSPLADTNTISTILSAGIPLLVYEDYDEITNSTKTIENKKGYEIITRKPSVEIFSLSIAEAIIRKGSIIHKYPEKMEEHHKTVLIAEDITTNQLIIEEIIKSIGLSPVTCCNGKQAFETFIQQHQVGLAFDVVIMDCEMPVMDGFESTEKIRHYEKLHQLKPALIIALSAHAEPEYRLRSKQSGMNLYLTKPVRADTLIQHIENHRELLA